MSDKSINLSLPQDYELYGIRIRKLPIGSYLKAVQTVRNLPELLLKQCFPGMKPDEVLNRLKSLDESALYEILGRLLTVVPEQFLRLVAELLEADYEHLLKLSPKELLDVFTALWKANEMKDFFGQIKALLGPEATLMNLAKKQSTGFRKWLPWG